jgi:hypothetical protein
VTPEQTPGTPRAPQVYVLVLNVGGYIGESTRSEIEYAKTVGRPVEYLEGDAR